MRETDITGKKFNRLTAIRFDHVKKTNYGNIYYWLFECECGNRIIARKNAVVFGQHKSCGCLRLEKLKEKKYNEFLIKKDYAIMIVYRKNKKIEVLIDKEDINKIRSIGSWSSILDKTLKIPSYYISHRYNNNTDGNGVIKLHRFIMNCPEDKIIDHINHNTLDNRKQNLKIVSHFENQQNLRSKSTEQTGVYFNNSKGYWVANITYKGKRYSTAYNSKEKAIAKRKEWETQFYHL